MESKKLGGRTLKCQNVREQNVSEAFFNFLGLSSHQLKAAE